MSVQCTACGGDARIQHRADEFPSVTLCYPCVRDWFATLYQLGVADGNPLIALYWFPSFTIPIPSDYETGAWTYKRIEGFKLKVSKAS